MPPPPAAALPPPHHRTVRRTTVVAAPVRLPSPVRPRRTSWWFHGAETLCAKAPPHGTRRHHRPHVIVTTPPSSPHPSAAVARPPPSPSSVFLLFTALSSRDAMILSWPSRRNLSYARRRIVYRPHHPHPSRRRHPAAPPSKTRTFYVKNAYFLYTLTRVKHLINHFASLISRH